jgi:hypothetical protein
MLFGRELAKFFVLAGTHCLILSLNKYLLPIASRWAGFKSTKLFHSTHVLPLFGSPQEMHTGAVTFYGETSKIKSLLL